jgi:hypothetical protein
MREGAQKGRSRSNPVVLMRKKSFATRTHRKDFLRRSLAGAIAFKRGSEGDFSFSTFSFLNTPPAPRNVLRPRQEVSRRCALNTRLPIPLHAGSLSPRGGGPTRDARQNRNE